MLWFSMGSLSDLKTFSDSLRLFFVHHLSDGNVTVKRSVAFVFAMIVVKDDLNILIIFGCKTFYASARFTSNDQNLRLDMVVGSFRRLLLSN